MYPQPDIWKCQTQYVYYCTLTWTPLASELVLLYRTFARAVPLRQGWIDHSSLRNKAWYSQTKYSKKAQVLVFGSYWSTARHRLGIHVLLGGVLSRAAFALDWGPALFIRACLVKHIAGNIRSMILSTVLGCGCLWPIVHRGSRRLVCSSFSWSTAPRTFQRRP